MTGIQRVGDLEIDQDLEFQWFSWRLQRACWAVMAAVVLAGLLGLFGSGPLGRGSAGDSDGPLRLDYPRFGHLESPDVLRVRLRAGRPGEARLRLGGEFLDAVAIERVEPEPLRVEAGPDGWTYVFLVAGPDGTASVTFAIRPERPGPISADVRLEGAPPLGFTQFVYP